MTDNGLDPALIAYAGAAIALLALIKLYFFQKNNHEAEQQQIAKRQEENAAVNKVAAEKAEAEKLAAEKTQQEQAATDKAEAEKLAVEKAQQEQAAAEKAEAEKLASEKAQQEQAAAEKVEAEKLAAEKAQQEQAAAEKEESERLAAEKAQQEQAAAEKAQQEQAAAEKLATEKVQEEQAAAEKAEVEKLAAEKAQDEQALADKAEAGRVAQAEKDAAEMAEAERVTQAEKETAEKAEAERVALAEKEAEDKAEAERVAQAEREAAEKAEIERVAQAEKEEAEKAPVKKMGFFAKVKQGLAKTKAGMTKQMGDLFLGAKEIDDELLEDLETILITSDIGMAATTEIIGKLTDQVDRSELKDPQALQDALKAELAEILNEVDKPLVVDSSKAPYVILMVGVNGVGKTTTIGKLAKKYQAEGKSVMLAAGDTFRAAAVEQLQVWGERNNVPVVAQHTGADSASVLFDAVQSAKAKGVDVLIADTAGRLQNKDNLMQELQKVIRVMQKLDPEAPHEVMLVLDAGTGQNGLSQAKIFGEAVGVTGITLTKLDGTAKGGIIFAIAKSMNIPIRFIGVGEQVDDLQPFEAEPFIEALFDTEQK
jgi:fused signal recognition particle receptor